MASEHQESFWTSIRDNPEQRRKAIIIVGVAVPALIAVLVVVLVLVLKHDAQTKCRLIDHEPQPDIAGRRAFPSQDYRALVRFVGHLKLSKNYGANQTNTFLDLNLQSVRYVHQPDSELIYLTLETDCATIVLEIFNHSSMGSYRLQKIRVGPKSPQVQFLVAECSIENVEFWYTRYYSCTKKQYYKCSAIKETPEVGSKSELPALYIAVNLLQFELDGDRISIQNGRFEKLAAECKV